MAPVAKAADLHWEDPDREDDGRGFIPDTWELPPRPVLRNVLRRLPRRNPDFDGASFVCKPWLALAVDGDRVVAAPQRLMPGLLLPEEQAIDWDSLAFLAICDGYPHDIAFPHARGARCVRSSSGWLVMVRKGPEGVVGAAGTATVHVVHPLLLQFRLPDEFSLFEIQVAADEEEYLVRWPLLKEARLRAGLHVDETDAEMLQREYKPDEEVQREYKPDEEGYPYITMIALSCSPATGRRGLRRALPLPPRSLPRHRAPRGRIVDARRGGVGIHGARRVQPQVRERGAPQGQFLRCVLRRHGAARRHPAGERQRAPAEGGEVRGQAVQRELVDVYLAVVARRRRRRQPGVRRESGRRAACGPGTTTGTSARSGGTRSCGSGAGPRASAAARCSSAPDGVLRRRADPAVLRRRLHLPHRRRERARREERHPEMLRHAQPEPVLRRRRWAQGGAGPTCLGHAVP
ncbi:hypothetical protein E2562_030222 [Oryza meyeriana var. granulata]|uniref:Uncharacterized protein n=1 Tax=Oryza meyeriana var. granulata TaxID=110450 RepID=A0A6G1D941_9ORYZ|nr:hypothetical protein E2562_030222 [Oryza meyeriana var. granulata]